MTPQVLPQSTDGDDFLVVGIGASAGGLDACCKLMDALPDQPGMAFILVQHLDPGHESMMVSLLASHTAMTVLEAVEGQVIERNCLYVIPPGTYLSVETGLLHLSAPSSLRGARLPFDFLLHSLARDFGKRAVSVVLSGSGADGSLGIKSVSKHGGLVIAQKPEEAAYDAMPRNAILTGLVGTILPLAEIPGFLGRYDWHAAPSTAILPVPTDREDEDILSDIIAFLRTRTAHDFSTYKRGTILRRIHRRMGMSPGKVGDLAHYAALLKSDEQEVVRLAGDLLIHVTSFFRDPDVFEFLAKTAIPDVIRSLVPGEPLRLWVAGCSSGEETYSLAMLIQEYIAAEKLTVRLQVFASDIDPEAIAKARDGTYPSAIAQHVSPERLKRFFIKDGERFRVIPELRELVVFAVQDILTDPPFSRINIISCRNLLIYLLPDAQARVISLFHFSLNPGGVLLLGASETIESSDSRFEVISKPARLFRHIGRSRPGELKFAMNPLEAGRLRLRGAEETPRSRQAALADLCRTLVIEDHAPAAVLTNMRYECLYLLGPTEKYLSVAPGLPTHDLFAMLRQDLRSPLRLAVHRAVKEDASVTVPGGTVSVDRQQHRLTLSVRPLTNEGEALLLICFLEETVEIPVGRAEEGAEEATGGGALEHELDATRAELRTAIRNLEISSEEQKAINEEALSINEEFQSANEELVTSKEELQSLNEELTALNGQLHETLERQRRTANDLQNILDSTDVAIIFLDPKLKIRFYTPATSRFFNVIPSDIGRPLSDLKSLGEDDSLLADAETVMRTRQPIEREIETAQASWYIRRILSYRAEDLADAGVVITFVDNTERRTISSALETARRQAEFANIAKSRFLAAASHDLRQPLQTLALIQGLLAKTVESVAAKKLVDLLDPTLTAMTGMLDTLLDINQIDAGVIQAEISCFSANALLDQLRDEFIYHARAKGLVLRVVPCSRLIVSDRRLLEGMMRNLLANALKYTQQGKILLGCRRKGGALRIEVYDTGIGIPAEELQAIFEEFHQVDNAVRTRSKGLGLGLAIVQRLGILLGHQVHVRSTVGRGSVFSVDVGLQITNTGGRPDTAASGHAAPPVLSPITASVLLVEDDPEVCQLLTLILQDEGHDVTAVADGVTAVDLVRRGVIHPALVLSDYNLPLGLDGLEMADAVRKLLGQRIPVIILTGDISTGTLQKIAGQDCTQLNKPIKLPELARAIQALLTAPPEPPAPVALAIPPAEPDGEKLLIYVVDDDAQICEVMTAVLEDAGWAAETFPSCEEFLANAEPDQAACLVVDAYLPGMSGMDLLTTLHDSGHKLPAIMITGRSDVPMAVQAMKSGASDFIEKPVGRNRLVASVTRAIEHNRDATKLVGWRESAVKQLAGLTARQTEIMNMVLAGHPSKNIAADLGISQRTVENHRAAIMKRAGVKSLPALARLALTASGPEVGAASTQPGT